MKSNPIHETNDEKHLVRDVSSGASALRGRVTSSLPRKTFSLIMPGAHFNSDLTERGRLKLRMSVKLNYECSPSLGRAPTTVPKCIVIDLDNFFPHLNLTSVHEINQYLLCFRMDITCSV